jgi:dihydrodipicolinate synthase/N-acetylneuraminate lyase
MTTIEDARRLTGVVVAAATPFSVEDGALDLAAVPRLAELYVAADVAAIMVGGTTGEFVAMSSDERMALLGEFVAVVDGRVPVIGHVGHAWPVEACRLAERAARVGVSCLTAILPYFHPVEASAIEAYLRDVAQVCPQLPFFVYNYPDATGNPLPVGVFEQLRSEPNLAGVKLSVESLSDIEPYLPLASELCVMSGNDALLVDFAARGGAAVVSGNACVRPELLVSLFQAVRVGDTAAAERLHGELVAFMATAKGAPDRFKALLRERGVDVGIARVRTHVTRAAASASGA